MPFPDPNFKKATLDEIKDGISQLNKTIVQLRGVLQQEGKKYWTGLGAGTAGAVGASLVFPPAGVFVMAGASVYCIDKAVKRGLARSVLQDCETLRDQFKQVYRARPGRRQFDIAARRTREKARKKKQPPHFWPGA